LTAAVLPRPVRARRLVATVVVIATALTVVPPTTGPAEAQTRTPVMGQERMTAAQMAAWFRTTPSRVANYRAEVSIATLARYYVEEGRAEGVAGDLAFIQGVLETGSFSWPSHGQVTPAHNNFAGMGACDGGTCTVARFRNARIGVRAQIQHLRAYADRTVTRSNLANPLESPRFDLVTPKGRAPNWEDFGGGNWASDPAYGTKILSLHGQMRSHASANGGLLSTRTFSDVPASHPHRDTILAIDHAKYTTGCTATRYCPEREVTRAETATFIARAARLPSGAVSAFKDVSGTHQPQVDAAAAAGITNGCATNRFCPTRPVTRAQFASMLQRTLNLPDRAHPFPDVAPSPHSGAIGALHHAGVVAGDTSGRYRPNAPVTRAQMASFLQRAFLR
jgi:hypothetical protein